MSYPFWDVDVGYGLLMAGIAVIHVFVSHFAIGGGLYLVVGETAARRDNDARRLAHLEKLSKFFLLVTVVFGALTGVGIWFIIGLLNPAATEVLIHNFVWGWAIEWTFFIVEICAAILYFYGWKFMSPEKFIRDNDPASKPKARLISNGSGLNLRAGAGAGAWNDVGTPVKFRVGRDAFLLGSLPDRVSEPTLAEGWLPIVEIRYTQRSPVRSEGMVPLAPTAKPAPPEIYRLEAFASTAPEFASHCLVFVKFDLAQGTNGVISVDVEVPPPLTFADGRLLDGAGRLFAVFDGSWKHNRNRLTASLGKDGAATLAVPCVPLDSACLLTVSPAVFATQRAACAATWKGLIGRGLQIEAPEPFQLRLAQRPLSELPAHQPRPAPLQHRQPVRPHLLGRGQRRRAADGRDAARRRLAPPAA